MPEIVQAMPKLGSLSQAAAATRDGATCARNCSACTALVKRRTVERAAASLYRELLAQGWATMRFETPQGCSCGSALDRHTWAWARRWKASLSMAALGCSRRISMVLLVHARPSAWLHGLEAAFCCSGGLPRKGLVDNARAWWVGATWLSRQRERAALAEAAEGAKGELLHPLSESKALLGELGDGLLCSPSADAVLLDDPGPSARTCGASPSDCPSPGSRLCARPIASNTTPGPCWRPGK
ncbi:hypothetical protein [Azohydromonas australica]|uniref:hypothetical protein n=1 Tax=Azohydromonas australica TaxID=364039 RepID=UPI001EE456FD|nr:hypothetical protein [Azohydromonas australica]